MSSSNSSVPSSGPATSEGGIFAMKVSPEGVVTLTPTKPEELGAWPVEGLGSTLDRLRRGAAAGVGALPRASAPPSTEVEDSMKLKLFDLATGQMD